MSIKEKLREMATVDLFKEVVATDAFVGRPFYFDFSKMKILSNDHWKEKVGGIAAGAFLEHRLRARLLVAGDAGHDLPARSGPNQPAPFITCRDREPYSVRKNAGSASGVRTAGPRACSSACGSTGLVHRHSQQAFMGISPMILKSSGRLLSEVTRSRFMVGSQSVADGGHFPWTAYPRRPLRGKLVVCPRGREMRRHEMRRRTHW